MPIMFPRDSTLCQLTEARKLKRIYLSATEQETSQLKLLYTNCLKYATRRDYFLCKIHRGTALCNRQDRICYLKNCYSGTFFCILRHKRNVLEVINHNTDE